MKKVLIFGTYPIKNPQHGGQKRLDAINREYSRAGFDVRYCAVYHKPFYADSGDFDIGLPAKYQGIVNNSPFTGDIICGNVMYEDVVVKKKVIKVITDFKPDIIHIEQVFPYLGLRRLLKEINNKSRIVFGSQNIEYSMKEEMLRSLGYDDSFITDKVALIKEYEIKLSQEADLTAAVSASDLEEHKKMGAKNVVLAPNGIYKAKITDKSINYWRLLFNKQSVTKTVLFVGSAHPPNWIGFSDMVGLGLGFLSSEVRVVFAGSISDYAQSELKKLKYDIGATTFAKRAYFAGRLSEEKLSGLLGMADVIILPITEGGGSNLKTAEAIVSEKKVVASRFAFRGFEELSKLPNIFIHSKPIDFKNAIIDALKTDSVKRNVAEQSLEKTVLWQNCLSNLVKEVNKL